MATAYIALGTNLGNREENIKNAVAALNLVAGVAVLKQSALYNTAPVGYANQPDFLNAAVLVETTCSPEMLLGACLGIEAAMGRVRSMKNGPRIIDLDLLIYEKEKRNTPRLVLPHPRMMERAFVLRPLCDICEDPRYRAALAQLENE